MTTKDLEYIDELIERLDQLPKIVELRIKIKWHEVSKTEQDILLHTYKDLDDLLNDTLAFINVKFPNRNDLVQNWKKIDFDPKLGHIKVHTNTPELIRSNWFEGIYAFENLLKNIRREIVLLIENYHIPDKNNYEKNHKSGKWERSHKIAFASLCVGLFVLIFGNNIYDRFIKKYDTKNALDNTRILPLLDTTSLIKELPYLENFPIIDKGLYVKYYYTSLLLGGVNVESIKMNARKISSEPIEIIRENNFVRMDISDEPFVEFEYKGKFYSIELTGRHYEFIMKLETVN